LKTIKISNSVISGIWKPKFALKVYFHFYIWTYTPELQGNSLKLNPKAF